MHRLSTYLFYGFLAALPVLPTLALIYALNEQSIFNYMPTGGDDLGYWAQVSGFVEADFNSGYYCWGEMTAPFSYFHFSVHGPGFPAIYGTLGKIVGWEWHSPPMFNMFFLCLAMSCAIYVMAVNKISFFRMALFSLLAATSWPLMIYLVSASQEVFHASAGIVFASIFAWKYHRLNQKTRIANLLCLALLAVMLVVRPTWSFLFLPYALFFANRQKTWIRAALCLAMILLIPASYFFWRYISSVMPYPHGPLSWILPYIQQLQFGAIPRVVYERSQVVIARMFDPERMRTLTIWFWFVWLNTFATLICLGYLAWAGFQFIKKHKDGFSIRELNWPTFLSFCRTQGRQASTNKADPSTSNQPGMILLFSASWMMALSVFNAIVIYGVEADAQARILIMPYMFMICLFSLNRIAYLQHCLLVLLLCQALLLPVALPNIQLNITSSYQEDPARLLELRDEVSTHVQYDPMANPWDNTMLINNYNRNVIAYPPGIGLARSTGLEWWSVPPRPKYALVDKAMLERLETIGDFELLADTSAGGLYLNVSKDRLP